jgi:hypothetical protein
MLGTQQWAFGTDALGEGSPIFEFPQGVDFRNPVMNLQRHDDGQSIDCWDHPSHFVC